MNYSVKIEKLWDEFINHDNICKDMRQDILNSWYPKGSRNYCKKFKKCKKCCK